MKMALKRGALVAAANWPVALAQATADALFKVLVAAPLVGGVILATLVINADIDTLRSSDWRILTAALISSLLQHHVVLAAFLLSLGLVVIGGSLFVFLVKGGTIGVLVRGERQAGPLEEQPLQFGNIASASGFGIELFVDSCRALFPRYARLGFVLLVVYLASGAAFAGILLWGSRAGESWAYTSLATVLFAIWMTFVNLLYLLVQVVIAADDCGVATAARRVAAFLRHERRVLAGVFGVLLAMVVLATGASLLAFTALGLIFLVPFVWLAAIPLQLLAFLMRALVFQYIDLTSIAAYATLYRAFSARTKGPGLLSSPEGGHYFGPESAGGVNVSPGASSSFFSGGFVFIPRICPSRMTTTATTPSSARSLRTSGGQAATVSAGSS